MPDGHEQQYPSQYRYIGRDEYNAARDMIHQRITQLSEDIGEVKLAVAGYDKYWADIARIVKVLDDHVAKEDDVQMQVTQLVAWMRVLGAGLLVMATAVMGYVFSLLKH